MTLAIPPLEIVIQHQGVVVVNKPAGLPSTGRSVDDPDCVQGYLMERLGTRRVWAVHQLDKGTSGLNIFVCRKSLVARWAAHLRYPMASKEYLALSHGRWPQPQSDAAMHVHAPIGFRRQGHKRFPALCSDGKPAHSVIHYRDGNDSVSLLEVGIRTGRTHQVRLHLASIGLPVMGDTLHGHSDDAFPGGCLALHAWRLRFTGDVPAPLRHLEAPVPPRIVALAQRWRLSFSSGSG